MSRNITLLTPTVEGLDDPSVKTILPNEWFLDTLTNTLHRKDENGVIKQFHETVSLPRRRVERKIVTPAFKHVDMTGAEVPEGTTTLDETFILLHVVLGLDVTYDIDLQKLIYAKKFQKPTYPVSVVLVFSLFDHPVNPVWDNPALAMGTETSLNSSFLGLTSEHLTPEVANNLPLTSTEILIRSQNVVEADVPLVIGLYSSENLSLSNEQTTIDTYGIKKPEEHILGNLWSFEKIDMANAEKVVFSLAALYNYDYSTEGVENGYPVREFHTEFLIDTGKFLKYRKVSEDMNMTPAFANCKMTVVSVNDTKEESTPESTPGLIH